MKREGVVDPRSETNNWTVQTTTEFTEGYLPKVDTRGSVSSCLSSEKVFS